MDYTVDAERLVIHTRQKLHEAMDQVAMLEVIVEQQQIEIMQLRMQIPAEGVSNGQGKREEDTDEASQAG